MTTHSTNEKAAPLVTETALKESFDQIHYLINRVRFAVDASLGATFAVMIVALLLIVGGAYGR